MTTNLFLEPVFVFTLRKTVRGVSKLRNPQACIKRTKLHHDLLPRLLSGQIDVEALAA